MKVRGLAVLLALGFVLVGCAGGEKEVGYGGEVKTAPQGGGSTKPGSGKPNGGKAAGSVGLE